MEEMGISSRQKRNGVKKMYKKNTGVDLTPMVDLGFLLLAFFIFTSTLAKPNALSIKFPCETKKAPENP